MINSRKVCLLVLLFLISAKVFAQTNVSDDFGFTSSGVPNANSNVNPGTSDNIVSVNPYTGIADVNVPVFGYSIDGVPLNVSVNYNCKGITVDQVASNVGLGWNIEAGGSITRRTNGIEDEITMPALGPYDVGYINSPMRPRVPEIRGDWCELISGGNSDFKQQEDEEDCFTANFGGRTVTFLINYATNSYTTECSPKSEIKVQLLRNGQDINNRIPSDPGQESGLYMNANIITFKITDEKGNVFEFDRGDYNICTYKSEKSPVEIEYYPTSRWVLKKVTTHTGVVIDYHYNSFAQIFPARKYQKVTEMNTHVIIGRDMFGQAWSPMTVFGGWHFVDSTIENLAFVSVLDKINYPNGVEVDFVYDPFQRSDIHQYHPQSLDDGALSYIKIKQNIGANGRSIKYKFNYSYLRGSNTDIAYEPFSNIQQAYGYTYEGARLLLRLKLNSITRIGTDDASTEPYYSFYYEEDVKLPTRLSARQDFYGYFNDKVGLSLYINNMPYLLPVPLHTTQLTYKKYDNVINSVVTITETKTYGIDKGFDFNKAKAGILTKVVNGLGGAVQIQYKDGTNLVALSNSPLNAYKYDINTSQLQQLDPALYGTEIFDGLIVDKIVRSDGFNIENSVITTYNYENGQRFLPGGYFVINTITDNIMGGPPDNPPSWISRDYYNFMVSPRDYPFGSNHGFKNVAVTTTNYFGEQLKKIRYSFSGIENLIFSNDPNVQYTTGWKYHLARPFIVKKEWMGLALEVTEVDGQANLISKTENTYIGSLIPGQAGTQVHQNFYSYKRPITSTLGGGDGYGYGSNSTLYQSFHQNKALLTNSKNTIYTGGQSQITETKYFYDSKDNDVLVEWIDSKGDLYHKHSLFNYSYPCPTSNFQMRETEQIWKIINPADSVITSYKSAYSLNHCQPGLPSFADIGLISKPLTKAQFFPQWITDFYKNLSKKRYTYDIAGNVKQVDVFFNYQTSYESKTTASSIWDWRNGKKIAEVESALHNEIAFTSFEGIFNNKYITDDGKGNLDFENSSLIFGSISDKPVTGSYYYLLKLNSSTNYDIVSTNNLELGKTYMLTFWARQAGFAITLGWQHINTQPISTVNGWTLYKAVFTANNTSILNIHSNGGDVAIDEVRLHPSNCTMTSYTFEPLFGHSSITDGNNNITYMEYDVFGRESIVRDINGNILSLKKNVNQGANN